MISVVVCTYNRVAYLPECLDCLSKQNVEKDVFEIIVVNNNSTDNTEEICRNFELNHPELSFRYCEEKKPGLSHARNKGIEMAKGEIICFIDDDGFAKTDYISEIEKITTNEKYLDYIAFGGKVIPRYNEGKEPKWLSKYIDGLVSKVDLGDKIKDFDKKYPAGCNMIFRKEFFEMHGGFNTDLEIRGDDKFVFLKLKAAGLKILYVPSIYVKHFIDDYRLEKSFIIRLSKVIGNSEKIRLKNEPWSLVKKALEYGFKFGSSLILSVFFVFQGQLAKAKYILLVRWFVIIGFFKKNVK